MTYQPIQHFALNARGRDFAVGDIHGHFTLLQQALTGAGFDPARDRLFSVGDLVDRGPESLQAIAWLQRPWFHAVRGNHEDYVYRHRSVDKDNWIQNGGSWFLTLSEDQQAAVAAQLAPLPFVIEVETPGGLVGIVHADAPVADWRRLPTRLEKRSGQALCLWSRTRIRTEDTGGVAGIRAVVVGHEPLCEPRRLGNVYHIDTRGWLPEDGGYFTLLDLYTLEAIPAHQP
jgi:serine/threonine protein phosphatase 1